MHNEVTWTARPESKASKGEAAAKELKRATEKSEVRMAARIVCVSIEQWV
jgi:hypothetical protein